MKQTRTVLAPATERQAKSSWPALRFAKAGATPRVRRYLTRVGLPALIFLVFFASPSSSQVVFSETFSGSYPGQWTVGHDGGESSYGWSWPNQYAYAYGSPSGGQFWYPNNLHVYLDRRNVSLAGYSSATLGFWYIVDTEANYDFFTVNVRNATGNWFELFRQSGRNPSVTWAYKTLDLSAFAGQSGLIVQFRFDSDGSVSGNPYNGVFVDSIDLTGVPLPPTVTTAAGSNVTQTGFRMNGTINPNGVATQAYFGLSTSPTGLPYNLLGLQTAGAGTSPVSLHSDVTDLTCGTTYYYRIFGSAAGVAVSGNIVSVTTSPCPDTTNPVVSAFNVTPRALTAGSLFTVSYTVSDAGGSGLSQAQLWRARDNGGVPGTWERIAVNALSGNGPVSGSFSDAPPVGVYWYGVHGVDNVANIGVEPVSPGPIQVVVNSATPTVTSVSSTPNPMIATQAGTVTVMASSINPATVQVLFTGPGCGPCVVPNNVLTKSGGQLGVPATLNTPGTYTVSLQNGAGSTPSNGLPVTVVSATPTVTSVSSTPNPMIATQSGTVTVMAGSIDPVTVQVLFTGPGCGPCVVPNNVLTKSGGHLGVPATLNTPGTYTVSLQNGAGSTPSNGLPVTVVSATPTVTTQDASNITQTGFGMNGTINPYGVVTQAYFGVGTIADLSTWSMLVSPQTAGAGTSAVPLHSDASGLTCGTNYYYRLWASAGNTAVPGNIVPVTTSPCASPPPSTQLGKVPNVVFNGDPVNTATGNYVIDHTDLSVPGRGLGLAFARFYNSLDANNGPLGPGWTHSYNVTLTVNADQSLQVRWGDGHIDYYDRTGSVYVARYPGVYDTLTRAGDGTFTILKKSQAQWHFTTTGRLDTITDRNGNAVSLSYDGAGRLVTVQEPGGRSLSMTYDGAGRITGITDPLPRTVAFAYDSAGQLKSVTDVDGGVETYTYDGNGQLLTATDPRGAIYLTNTYDTNKRVVTQADAKGNLFQFAYDPATGQTTITDPLGQSSVDAYELTDVLNPSRPNRLIRQTDRLGRSVSYTYDQQNNRTSITDKNGHTATYTYDTFGNVVGKVDMIGQTTAITYDALNNPLTRTDEAKGVTRFTYDSHGNLLTTTDPLNHVSTITYDAYGEALTLTDANGGVVTNTYDSAGNLISVRGATNAVTTFAYDAVGRKQSVTDARAHRTDFTYDGSGRVLTTTDALGHVVTNVYDADGNRTQTTDARGGVAAFTYDEKSLLRTMTDARGGLTRYTYDKLDRRLTATDALGQVTTFAYDAEGRVTQTTLPTGSITRIAYDGVGNKISLTDANANTTQFAYDALNRLVTTTDAMGHATLQTYDELGHVTKSTDAAARITAFAYDAAGHLIQVTDAAGGTARYTYDAVGNRLSVTDPNSQTTTYTYDAANRLRTSRDPLGRTSSNTYDTVGNKATVTDAKGATHTYTYDAVNRRTVIQPSAGATVTFSYDAAGNRTALADAVGTTAYTYDALNRLTKYVDAYGQAIGYEYDAIGNRTAIVHPDGKRVSYGFDGAQRMTRVTDWGGRVTQYTYDAAGQLTGMTNANGTTVASTFDNTGQLTNLSNRRADGSVLASYAYTLDAIGNRTAVTQQEPLAALPASASVSYVYNAANQIQTAGAAAFGSDANGNLTSRVAPTGTTAYSWDIDDRLTQANDGTTTAQYVYNGVGTRLARTVNGGTTRFVVDSQPTLSQLLVETDAAGAVIARYVYGLGLVSRVDAAGAALTYHFDSRGSTIAMTDAAQAVVNRYAYDEFGAVRQKQETIAQPFQYVSQLGVMQEPNGLLFMRARYYETASGRFLSQDSDTGVDKDGQSWNRYTYVQNRPIDAVDPEGRFLNILGGAAVGAAIGVVGYGFHAVVTHEWEWEGLAGAFAGGAVEGACVGATGGLGLISGGVCGAAGGLASSLAEQELKVLSHKQQQISGEEAVASEVVGGVLGTFASAVGASIKRPVGAEAQNFLTKYVSGANVNYYIGKLAVETDASLMPHGLFDPTKAYASDPSIAGQIGRVAVTTREQHEVQSPVSTTNKKPKRDVGR